MIFINKRFNKDFFLIILFLLFHTIGHSLEVKTIAFVNNKIITNVDLENEVFLNNLINQDQRINMNLKKKIALDTLIEKILKQEEISKSQIAINENEIKKIYSIFLKNINIHNKNINKIYLDLLYEKFKIDFEWNKIITLKYRNIININTQEIENLLNKNLESKISKEELIKREQNRKIMVYEKLHLIKLKKKSYIKIL